MSVEYFPHGISKPAFTCLSCRHYYNVRVKYNKMNTEGINVAKRKHDEEIKRLEEEHMAKRIINNIR